MGVIGYKPFSSFRSTLAPCRIRGVFIFYRWRVKAHDSRRIHMLLRLCFRASSKRHHCLLHRRINQAFPANVQDVRRLPSHRLDPGHSRHHIGNRIGDSHLTAQQNLAIQDRKA